MENNDFMGPIPGIMPTDEVLVRNYSHEKWHNDRYSFYDDEREERRHVCYGGAYAQCMRYAWYNSHLVGSKDIPAKNIRHTAGKGGRNG